MEVWTSPSGKTLVDFGQNLVGWLKFTSTRRGRHDDHRPARRGDRARRARRPAAALGAGDRHASSCSGGDGRLRADLDLPRLPLRRGHRAGRADHAPTTLVAVVVVPPTCRGSAPSSCSDALLNQLHSNVVWGQRGNFLDLPTDCPQRDERLGWTGDIAVFAPTAAYLFDVSAASCATGCCDLRRRAAGRRRHGAAVVPDVLKCSTTPPVGRPDTPTAIWSDAGGLGALGAVAGVRRPGGAGSSAYPSMAAHVRRVRGLVSPNGLWDTGFQFGDWLDPTAPPDDPSGPRPTRTWSPRPASTAARADRAGAPRVLGRPTTRPSSSRLWPSGPGPPSTSTT